MTLSIFFLLQLLQPASVQTEAAQKPSVAAAAEQPASVQTEVAQEPSVAAAAEQPASVQTEAAQEPSVAAEAEQPASVQTEAAQEPSVSAAAEQAASLPPPSPAPAPSAEAAYLRFKLGNGLRVSTQDNALSLRARLMAQLRNSTAFSDKASKSSNEFSARAIRIMLEGRAFDQRLVVYLQTGISPDEFDQGSGLLDAWVSWKFGRDATLRVGQQRIIYDMACAFVRTGYLGITRENVASEFGIVREIGAVLFSDDFLGLNELLAYRLGIYGGQGRNRFALKHTGFLYMGRLTLRPFGYFEDTLEGDLERLDKPRLAIGISAAYSDNITRTGASTGTVFDSTAFPNMDALYLNADALLKWKGFYIAAQYSRRTTSKDFVSNGTTQIWGRSGHGYLVKASAMLSNELELGGRWSQQFGIGQTDPSLLAELKNEFALAMNYHFFGHALRLQAEYAARFTDPKQLYQHGLRLQLQAVF